jgi:hypothetical protein
MHFFQKAFFLVFFTVLRSFYRKTFFSEQHDNEEEIKKNEGFSKKFLLFGPVHRNLITFNKSVMPNRMFDIISRNHRSYFVENQPSV